MDDLVVRERSFTTPLTLSHLKRGARDEEGAGNSGEQSKRAAKRARQNAAAATAAKKGEGGKQGEVGGATGKGDKGKGKGKKGEKDPRCAAKTPDGKGICFAYNTRGQGCQRKACTFEHVCGVCFQKGHGAYSCPQGPKHQ